MFRKTLSIVAHEPDTEVRDLILTIEKANRHFMVKMEFIKKQIEDLSNQKLENLKPVWTELESHLKSLERLPAEYNSDEHMLYLDPEDGVLVVADKEVILDRVVGKILNPI